MPVVAWPRLRARLRRSGRRGDGAQRGSVGEYFWGGMMGTTFWISPRDDLFAILMVQSPEYREYFRVLFRSLVYAALI